MVGVAVGAVPEETPALALADHGWLVEGGGWTTPTAVTRFGEGLAFEVLRDGSPVGVVVVAPVSVEVRPREAEAAGLAGVVRSLGLGAWSGPTWQVSGDLAWRLGDAGSIAPEWRAVRRSGGSVETDEGDVLVFADREWEKARRKATELVATRPRELADLGHPLASVLSLHPAEWALAEVRTELPLGIVAGAAPERATPWLTTLVADPLLDGGRPGATLVLDAWLRPGLEMAPPPPDTKPDSSLVEVVDRSKDIPFQGFRTLATETWDSAWRVELARGELSLAPEPGGGAVRVVGSARLDLVAQRQARMLAIEVPAVLPDALDLGSASVPVEWKVDGVSWDGGADLRFVLPEVDPAARSATRPDRRLVLVDTGPVEAQAARSLRVRWSQRVPYGAPEILAERVVGRRPTSPLVPALPRLAGERTAFPYSLVVDGGRETQVLASGKRTASGAGPGAVTRIEVEGARGAAAVVWVGRLEEALHGSVRLVTDDADAEMALALERAWRPIGLWSGVEPASTSFVQVGSSYLPSAGVWAEALAGLRPQAVLEVRSGGVQAEYPGWWAPGLPETETVLGGEALAAAAWSDRAGPAADGAAWLDAFGRAFVLEVLEPKPAAAWRAWMSSCVGALGLKVGFSPAVAGPTGLREPAVRCGAPFLVGPMLDDRLGATKARLARRAILSGRRVDLGFVRAAILAQEPDAGPWVDRWLGSGEPVELTVSWSASPKGELWRVEGTLTATSPLAGAPVTLRVARGKQMLDVVVRGSGAVVPFGVDLAFEPRSVTVDPDRRVLRTR